MQTTEQLQSKTNAELQEEIVRLTELAGDIGHDHVAGFGNLKKANKAFLIEVLQEMEMLHVAMDNVGIDDCFAELARMKNFSDDNIIEGRLANWSDDTLDLRALENEILGEELEIEAEFEDLPIIETEEQGNVEKVSKPKGSRKNPHRRFTDDQIREMFRLKKAGFSGSKIARQFECSSVVANNILRRDIYADVDVSDIIGE